MPTSELKLISWTALIVAILGVASVFSLMQPPQGFNTTASRSAISPGGSRSIASIPAGSSAKSAVTLRPSFANVATEMQTMDVKTNCKSEEPIKVADTIREVRLTGNSCAGAAKIVTTEIKNVSNGFVATVFRTAGKSFTTDYVTLVKGANRILVREQLANGKTNEREYQIERR